MKDYISLSLPQQDIYYEQLLYPGTPIYSIGAKVDVRGELSPAILEEAIRLQIAKHDILHSVVVPIDDKPYLNKLTDYRVDFSYFDFSQCADPFAATNDHIQKNFQEPIVIYGPGLLGKYGLFKLAGDHFHLFVKFHHLIVDGWSTSLLFAEIRDIYASVKNGSPDTSPGEYHYSEFVADDQRYLESEEYELHRLYWKEKLKGDPIVFSRKFKNSGDAKIPEGERITVAIDRGRYNKLTAYAEEIGVTCFHYLLGILYVYFSSVADSKAVTFGLPLLNRRTKKFKNTVGLFANVSPFRLSFDRDGTFGELLVEIKRELRENFRYQRFPMSVIARDSGRLRDMDSALYSIFFSYEKHDYSSRIDGIESTIIPLGNQYARGPVAVYVREFDALKDVTVDFDFSRNYFDADEMERCVGGFMSLLGTLLRGPDMKIRDISFLTAEEEDRIVRVFNDTGVDYGGCGTVLELLAEQVRGSADRVALIFGERRMSYGELEMRSDRLAGCLRSAGVGRGELVPVCVERSPEMVVAILGVWKAGGCYVPVDRSYPADRIGYILADTGARLLVCDSGWEELGYEGREMRKVEVGKAVDEGGVLGGGFSADGGEDGRSRGSIGSGDRAYVMYTSGSTGRPKGVEIPHGALVNFLLSMQASPGISSSDRLLAVTTYSFDISLLELFLPLIAGAQCIIVSREKVMDGVLLREEIGRERPSMVQCTPGLWQVLLDAGWEGDKGIKALCGGEKLNRELGKELLGKVGELWNMYGPTETTIWSCIHRFGAGDEGSVIGRPIGNTEVYILNEDGGLLPIGVAGEICIGGRGVALGYLNRAELTAEKFIMNPYKSGGRLYRTGDRGRWVAGGEIEYLGRRDDQVKIRGYRVEPGEVEQVLLGHGGVREAVVVSGRDGGGSVYLVGYMVMREGEAAEKVRLYLRERLPEYMVPSYLIELEALPLSVNGKVDRKRLPGVEEAMMVGGREYVAARDETERRLVEIWEEVLGRTPVGIRDNFFEIGGHSLKATKILARIYKEFGVRVDLRQMFSHATIGDLSGIIAGLGGAGGYEAIPKTEVRKDYELSHAQQRLWILSQLSESLVAYNIPEAYVLKGALNREYLSAALEAVTRRHESLRTVFITEQGVPRQKVLEGVVEGFGLEEYDLRGVARVEEEVRGYVERGCVRPFSLEGGPLWRVQLFRLREEEYVLLLVMHHIITDGWSMEVLAEEVLELYGSYTAGREPILPEVRIQYKDYVYWQKGRMTGEAMREHERYWLERFSGELPVLALPLDGKRPLFRSYRGSKVELRIGRELTAGLKEMGNRFGVTMYMTLLGAVNALLYRYTGQTDIVIGTPDGGRDHPDLERQIGVYIRPMPVRAVFNKDMTFGELLSVVKGVTTDAYAHRLYPFDRLVEALNLVRGTGRSPLYDVVINFQNVQARKEIAKKFTDILVYDYERLFVPSATDIRWQFMEEEDQLTLHLEYNTALFSKNSIELMKDRFELLLNQFVAQPYTRLHEIELFANDEGGKMEIGNHFNMTF